MIKMLKLEINAKLEINPALLCPEKMPVIKLCPKYFLMCLQYKTENIKGRWGKMYWTIIHVMNKYYNKGILDIFHLIQQFQRAAAVMSPF